MPENNNQTALQLTYRVENNQVVFDGYRLVDNRGNVINNQDSWYDDIVNDDLSGPTLTVLQESLRINGGSAISRFSVLGVNVALTALQNFRNR